MKNKKTFDSLQSAAATLTVISLILALFSWLTPVTPTGITTPTETPQNEKDLKIEVESLKQEINDLKGQIGNLSNVPTESQLNIRLESLETSVNSLDSRFTKIEDVILQNPSEALELPLLKQQVVNNEKTYQDEINRLNADIDRLYSLLVGSLVALLITILSPRLLDLFRKDREQAKGDQK